MEFVTLVLASGSPRRRELLDRFALRYEVRPPDVDETPNPGESASALVERLARAKARAVATPGTVAVAADTVVLVEGEIAGKPTDPADNTRMIGALSGGSHEVVSGVAVLVTDGDGVERAAAAVETTLVHVEPLPTDRQTWYVDTGEGDDKAGGYAIQGRAGLFADRIEGSVSNVIGLPLPLLDELCRSLGIDLLEFAS